MSNEKPFRDRGSGFDYYPISCRTTGTWQAHGRHMAGTWQAHGGIK